MLLFGFFHELDKDETHYLKVVIHGKLGELTKLQSKIVKLVQEA
jgi:hypothetical protein